MLSCIYLSLCIPEYVKEGVCKINVRMEIDAGKKSATSWESSYLFIVAVGNGSFHLSEVTYFWFSFVTHGS